MLLKRSFLWLLFAFVLSSVIWRNPKVFVIGDSISMHYGPYLAASLSGFFTYDRKRDQGQALQNLDVPTGANAGDSGMVLRYLQNLAADTTFSTDYILLNCGLHDIKVNPATGQRQVSPEQYKKNLTACMQLVRENLQASLVWVNTTPVIDSVHNAHIGFARYQRDVALYNAMADSLMKAHQVPVIDLFTFTRQFGPAAYTDHVHFRDAVREKQADFIAGSIVSLIKYGL